ncbi:MAG: M23 family metallopeptidase [Acidobacteria bacterium]|nr:M23 family metallopeptidase [Acidobacteriota bacterium]
MLRWLLALLVVIALAVVGAYTAAGRGTPPLLTINKPDKVVGQTGSVDVTAEAPNARFTALSIAFEQNGKTAPLFTLDERTTGGPDVTQIERNQLHISRGINRQSIPNLRSGPARIVVTATRPSFLNLVQLTATTSKDFQVRLDPPRLAVVSTHHYVNHGGSEMVVYKATPPDVISGVRVGDIEYLGYPAPVTGADPSLKVAFFALLYDQPLNTPIAAFARDEAGNQAKTSFVDNVFEKPFKKSRIPLDDGFIGRVVPEILEHSSQLKMTAPSSGRGRDLVPAFLKINGDLRKINADEILALAAKSSATRFWSGPFVQLGNSQVEASFADHRTYLYDGKEVDQQVHLGFDLAVTSHVAVVAANAGAVVHAGWLGIYGNCAIIDHGLGVQSLYGHLSSFEVKVGDTVTRGETIGRSGMTGLAGGDHLHFTMLVAGRMVNPVEWWDPHWIADRVERKLGEAR